MRKAVVINNVPNMEPFVMPLGLAFLLHDCKLIEDERIGPLLRLWRLKNFIVALHAWHVTESRTNRVFILR